MLQTLKDYPPEKAQGILSRMILDRMPDPGIEAPVKLSVEEQELRHKIVEEVKHKLKKRLKRGRRTPEEYRRLLKEKVFNSISQEIPNVARLTFELDRSVPSGFTLGLPPSAHQDPRV